MGVFMWDFSGRCWSTVPDRCDVYSVEVPSWPGALWLQQYSFELKMIYSAFLQALLTWALCHASCGSALQLTYARLASSMMRVYIKHKIDLSSVSFSFQHPNHNPKVVKTKIHIYFISLSIRL